LVERVRSRGVFLHRLISDLLDFAKVEAGRMEVSRQPVALRPLVEQIVATFGPLVERKGLAFEVHIAADLPVVAGDPHRLEQVLSNLLANALKFTDAGAITVDVRVVDAALPGFTSLGGDPIGTSSPMVGVFLGDTGVGIRTGDLRQLASDFQQLHGVGARFGGTGLGLSISRRLVDLLGGRLLVQSRYGSGSTFAVLLPVLDEVAAARARRATPTRDTSRVGDGRVG
jgi:signal transduction histidine kinase